MRRAADLWVAARRIALVFCASRHRMIADSFDSGDPPWQAVAAQGCAPVEDRRQSPHASGGRKPLARGRRGSVNDQQRATHDHDKDPAEQEALARDLGEELTELFAEYVRGEVDFADLTFQTYETLQDLFVVASGAYELEYDSDDEESSDDDGDVHDRYDEAAATEEQEELAQEPAGP
jgi:hypothetical protein